MRHEISIHNISLSRLNSKKIFCGNGGGGGFEEGGQGQGIANSSSPVRFDISSNLK